MAVGHDRGADPLRKLAQEQWRHALEQATGFAASHDEAQLDAAVSAVQLAVDLAEQAQAPELMSYLRAAEQWLLMRWTMRHRTDDLDAIIDRYARIDQAGSAGAAADAGHHFAVALAFEGRFGTSGDPADIDEAVRRWQLALEAGGELEELSEVYREGLTRAESTRRIMADDMFGESLETEFPGDADDPLMLRVHAMGFVLRYRQGGPQSDADRATALLRRAIQIAREAKDVASCEGLLGDIATLHSGRSGGPAARDEAIRHYTAAVTALGDGAVSVPEGQEQQYEHDRFISQFSRLVNALTSRALSTGEQEHLDEALRVVTRISADPRLSALERGQLWISMTAVLEGLVRANRRRADLDAAVTTARRAVEATRGTAVEPQALSHLATSLGLGFEIFDEAGSLLEAAMTATRAVEKSDDADPARALRQLNAANIWFLLGDRHRDVGHLDNALAQLQDVGNRSGEHRGMALLRTQLCRHARHEIAGDPADLDAAVVAGLAHREGRLRLESTAQPSALLLCRALARRGLAAGRLEDFDQALAVGLEVIGYLSAGDPRDPRLVFYLRAEPARDRHKISGDPADLDLAIAAAEAALGGASAEDTVTFQIEFAEMLRTRAGGSGADDLRAAAGHFRAAADGRDQAEPEAAAALLACAETLTDLFDCTGLGADADAAASLARELATRPGADAGPAIRAWILLARVTDRAAGSSISVYRRSDAVRAAEAAVAAAAGHPLLAEASGTLVQTLMAAYSAEGDYRFFARAEEVLTDIAAAAPHGEQRAWADAQLGRLHGGRHDRDGALADLDRAIELLARAVAGTTPESPWLQSYARELYRRRAQREETPSEVPPGPSEAAVSRAEDLLRRSAAERDTATVQQAITAWFALAASDPARHAAGLVAALGNLPVGTENDALRVLYHRLAVSPANPDRVEDSILLLQVLHGRWKRTLRPPEAEALRAAIVILRGGGTAGDFALAAGEALHEIFSLSGDEAILGEAISALEQFLGSAADDPRRDDVAALLASAREQVGSPLRRPRAEADLANARFLLHRSAEHARELLAATERALAAAPPGHPERPNLLCNVSNASLLTAQLGDDPDAIDRAVAAARAGVAAVRELESSDRAMLENASMLLAGALLVRIQDRFDPGDAAEAAELAEGLIENPRHGLQAQLLVVETLLLAQPHPAGTPSATERAPAESGGLQPGGPSGAGGLRPLRRGRSTPREDPEPAGASARAAVLRAARHPRPGGGAAAHPRGPAGRVRRVVAAARRSDRRRRTARCRGTSWRSRSPDRQAPRRGRRGTGLRARGGGQGGVAAVRAGAAGGRRRPSRRRAVLHVRRSRTARRQARAGDPAPAAGDRDALRGAGRGRAQGGGRGVVAVG